MSTIDRFNADCRERHPFPGDDPVARLRHVVEVFTGTDPTDLAVMATSNVYGRGVKTGLTFGDLAELLRLLGG